MGSAPEVPLLGVNLGHVGFLAELETSDLTSLPQAVIEGREIERRLVLQVEVSDASEQLLWSSFAINEVSPGEADAREDAQRLVHVDAHPLPAGGATGYWWPPLTGSTAYAFFRRRARRSGPRCRRCL